MRDTGRQWLAEHCPIQGAKDDRSLGVRRYVPNSMAIFSSTSIQAYAFFAYFKVILCIPGVQIELK
jgi:hypothetical protein